MRKNPHFEAFRNAVFATFGEHKNKKRDMTLGEAVSYLLCNNTLISSSTHNLNKDFVLFMIKGLSQGSTLHLTHESVIGISEQYQYNKRSTETLRSKFVKIVIGPLIQEGLILKSYKCWVGRRIEGYEAGIYRNAHKDCIIHDIVGAIQTNEKLYSNSYRIRAAKELFSDIDMKKWSELSNDDIARLRDLSHNVRYCPSILNSVAENAVARGVKIDESIFNAGKELRFDFEFSFDDDSWTLKEGNVTSELSFKNYEFDKKLKWLVKQWMKWRIESNYKKHRNAFKGLSKILLDFLDEKKMPLKKFNRRAKRELDLWLIEKVNDRAKGYTESTCDTYMKFTRQFLRHVDNFYTGHANKAMIGIIGERIFKKRESKGSFYSEYELKALSEAIKRDKDVLVTSALKLAMLTAKRTEEILSLKRGCIIQIDKFKYLKYTNFKTRTEDKVPIYTPNETIGKDLFSLDAGEIIADIIEKLEQESDKCLHLVSQEKRDYIFLYKLENRSSSGQLATLLAQSTFSERLKRFKQRNNIRFEVHIHKFRHTIASRGIRGGMSSNDVASILGNKTKTVERYYEKDITKEETLKLEVSPVVNALEDAQELGRHNSIPEAVSSSSAKDFTAVVPGGFCKEGKEAMMKCKYYNSLFGSGGCLGCSQLATTEDNIDYYEELKDRISEEHKSNKGTPFETASKNKLSLIEDTLYKIHNTQKDQSW